MRYFRSSSVVLVIASAVLGWGPMPAQDAEASLERRRRHLDEITQILPRTNQKITGRINLHDKSWEDWQARTQELPPDFETMPSTPRLPDPLQIFEGGEWKPIRDLETWERQRQLIRLDFEKWFYGTMPPAPGNLRGTVTAVRPEGGVTVRDVRLEFGPDHRSELNLQLIIPPGPGPFPVFLTNHPRSRPWVNTAVRRGYIACIYFAMDPIYGHEDDSDKFLEAHPESGLSTIGRWAWAAMRAVDYLETLPEVDKEKIGITGHSRNGKQALLAAAFDERIGAVVASSGNTGEGNPWRFTTDMFRNESIEQITGNFPHWFHPRLRFFAGREHKLPVDQNSLMAMVAPRGLLLASAYSETQGNPWGFEQVYRSVREVYRFLGQEDKAQLYLRPGEHPTTAADIELYMDFFDSVFGRKGYPRQETWTHGYNFDEWRSSSKDQVDVKAFDRRFPGSFFRRPEGGEYAEPSGWELARGGIRERIEWVMGGEPAGVPMPLRTEISGSARTSDGWLSVLYGRPFEGRNMRHAPVAFGDDLRGDLFYPAGDDGKTGGPWPVVVWLHPYAYSTGYSRGTQPSFESLTRRGFAVFAFDQIGFGTRVLDTRRFYERYPRWSLMGKMVADTRAAVSALAALQEIDSTGIYLAGYALGAKVALYTAALDDQVQGVVSVAGFTPLRATATPGETEGIRHYSHLHGLLPRFGFFLEAEDRLPVDYDELLALVAPRPLLVVAPTLDRYAPLHEVRQTVEHARRAYQLLGQPQALRLETPLDFNRFTRATEEQVFDWLAGIDGKRDRRD